MRTASEHQFPMTQTLARILIVFCIGLLPISAFSDNKLPDAVSFRITLELGDVERAREWLDKGLDPNFQGDLLGSGLHIAAWMGNIRLLELFYARGARINGQNKNGEQALHLAALQGHTAASEWLIAHGANINPRQNNVWTALHYAAFSGNRELINKLLDKGAYIDAQAPNGTTPLMAAIYDGKREAAELFVRKGADRSLKNDWGDGALEWAIKYKQTDLAKLIASPEQFGSGNRPKPDYLQTPRVEAVPADLQKLLNEREELVKNKKSTQQIDDNIAALRAKYIRQSMSKIVLLEDIRSLKSKPPVAAPPVTAPTKVVPAALPPPKPAAPPMLEPLVIQPSAAQRERWHR